MIISSLDTTSGIVPVFECNQGETQKQIQFQLSKDVTGTFPVFYISLNEDMVVKGRANISNENVCSFFIPINANSIEGRFSGQVVFFENEQMLDNIATYPFEIYVHHAPLQKQFVTISDNDIQEDMDKAITDIKAKITEMDNKYVQDNTEWDNKFSELLDTYKTKCDTLFNNMRDMLENVDIASLSAQIMEMEQTLLDVTSENSNYLRLKNSETLAGDTNENV